MAAPKSNSDKLLEEKTEWEALTLICPRKETFPNNLTKLHTWVQTIATCLKAVTDNNDKIGPDPYTNGYELREYFEPLQGGILMDADGANNDCLIHSFLTCVCPHFRKYERLIRRKIARYFRRFIATQIHNINQGVLHSFLPLSTSELDFLCKQYDVPFIVVKGSMYPVDREMELLPKDDEKFWDDNENSISLIYYIIHGSGSHFTPVAWNKLYEKIGLKHTELKPLRDKILEAQTKDVPINEIRKQATDKVMNEFLNDDPAIKKIKAEIARLSTQQEKIGYIHTNILGITRILHNKINSLDPPMDYRKDHAYSNELAYLTSLIGGAPAAPLPLPKNKVFALEDMDLEAGLEASRRSYEEEQLTPSDDVTLAKALLNSLETEKNDKAKRVASSIQLLSSRPADADVRKTVHAIAQIGNKPSTTYTVFVGRGVFVEPTSRGGKRRTIKAKITKRKTKKLKK
jgi:hypothetical protein